MYRSVHEARTRGEAAAPVTVRRLSVQLVQLADVLPMSAVSSLVEQLRARAREAEQALETQGLAS